MTDDFESKLRQLKPFRGTGVPAKWRKTRSAAVCRLLSAVSIIAATVLVIVCLIPKQEKLQNAKNTVIPAQAGIQTRHPCAGRGLAVDVHVQCLDPSLRWGDGFTMRQQLAQLLDEMSVANPIAEEKPVYPVIEIVMSHESRERNAVERPDQPAELSGRTRLRVEEYTMLMF
jgi:hypothetical protein